MISALISLLVFALIVFVVAYVVSYLVGLFLPDARIAKIIYIIAGLIVLLQALKIFGLIGHAAYLS